LRGGHHDVTTLGGELHGVGEQVAQGPDQSVAAPVHHRRLDVGVDGDVAYPGVRPGRIHTLVEALVEAQRLEHALAAFTTRQLGQVGHQRRQLVDLGDHVVGEL